MQAIDYADALNAWQNMTSAKGDNTWCIFAEGKRGDKRVLEVVGTGTGPGMRSVAQKVKSFMQKGLPAWGGFQVDAIDDRLNAKAVCPRFIGFQIIPDECSFSQRAKVLEVKGVVQTKVMTNLALMFECETWEELNDCTGIAKRLRSTCGAHVPTLYDFGGNEKRRTSVGERDGLPTSRPVLILEAAQEAWRNIMNDKDDASYVLFGLNADKKRLEVLAGGGGPGLAGCKAAAEEVIKKQVPFWGGYRVYALDAKGNATTSVRTKFIGFQLIPEGTPPMAKAKVSIVKPMIQSRVMPHVSCFIEAETLDEICDPDIISAKLTKCAGSDAPSSYDFTAASKATLNSVPTDPAAEAEAAKKKEMEESIEREREEQIAARQKQLEEAEKEREENQLKADELMREEAERRVQEDGKMPQDLPDDMKNILAGMNQVIMAEAAQKKIEEVERAANQRYVDEEVAREQEERRVQENKKRMESREAQVEEALRLEEEEAARRAQEEPHMPSDLPEEKRAALKDIGDAIIAQKQGDHVEAA